MKTLAYLYPVIVILGVIIGINIQKLFSKIHSNFDSQNNTEAESSLQFVISIYRHGIRSPDFPSFPTDSYKNRSKYFPDGDVALTKTGKQLMYNVGTTIRKRYGSFLGPNFSEDNVHFVSTNTERTMMSAMLVSNGMFPPVTYQKWSTDMTWQPIPIWLDNDKMDKTSLLKNSSLCPRFKKDSSDVTSKAKLPDIIPEHHFLYTFISERTGKNITSVFDIFALWDVLECELLSGYTLPKWTSKVFPEKMKTIVAETFNLTVNGTASMLRILSGPLFHHIYDLLLTKIDGSLVPNWRMYLHAGHDISVLTFLRGIGYKELLVVKPGDGIFLELHYSSDIYHVKVFYISLLNTGEVFNELTIPGCGPPCSLTSFLSLATNLSPDAWEVECFK